MIDDSIDLIDRWEHFGMKYRGRWNPTNIYIVNDVVWFDDVAVPKEGTESYFFCVQEHISEQPDQLKDKEIWSKYI